MKAPLVFAPVTRWVLAWPDGAVLRHYNAVGGADCGPALYFTRREAVMGVRDWADWHPRSKPLPKPVKVRVTIEVAK